MFPVPSNGVHQESYDLEVAGVVHSVLHYNREACSLLTAGNDVHLLIEESAYRPIITSHAAAKDCITVGATYSDPLLNAGKCNSDTAGTIRSLHEWANFSSSNLFVEGRVAPDMVAPEAVVASARSRAMSAENLAQNIATNVEASYEAMLLYGRASMAAPAVTGSIVILRNMSMDRAGSTAPSGALLKALVIRSAVDLFGSAMELPVVGGAERYIIG